jgi:hypothetical protein
MKAAKNEAERKKEVAGETVVRTLHGTEQGEQQTDKYRNH